MSAHGNSGDDPQPAASAGDGGGSGPLSGFNVPWIVLLAAGLPVVMALLLAMVGAVLAAVVAEEPIKTIAFPAILGLLSGNEIGLSAGGEFFETAGSGRAGLRALPLGIVTITALLFSRVGFTRAWLHVGIGSFGWAPPVAGASLALFAWFLAMLVGSFTGIDLGFVSANLSVRPTLTGLLLVGAGPWLLGMMMVRRPTLDRLVLGLVVLQLVFAALVTGFAINDIIADRWLSGGEQLGMATSAAVGSLMWSLNGVVVLLWWPFLGALGLGGSAAAVSGLAGESTRIGFLEAATHEPSVWVLPVIAVVGLIALTWFQPPARNWREVWQLVGRSVLALAIVFLPALWAGRVRTRGQGELAGEFIDEMLWMGGTGTLTGSMEARITATFGAVGMPIRLVPALAIWALIVFVVAVIAAQASGASWASNEALADEARRAGGSMATRVRAAAQAAQRAAAQATEHAPTGTGSDPGQTRPDAWSAPPRAQPTSPPTGSPAGPDAGRGPTSPPRPQAARAPGVDDFTTPDDGSPRSKTSSASPPTEPARPPSPAPGQRSRPASDLDERGGGDARAGEASDEDRLPERDDPEGPPPIPGDAPKLQSPSEAEAPSWYDAPPPDPDERRE